MVTIKPILWLRAVPADIRKPVFLLEKKAFRSDGQKRLNCFDHLTQNILLSLDSERVKRGIASDASPNRLGVQGPRWKL